MDTMQLLQQLIAAAGQVSTISIVMFAWMLEKRRADRLEAIALNRQEKQEQLALMQQKTE